MWSRDVVNICVHGIGSPGRQLEPGEDEYWVGEPQFADILDAVAELPSMRLSFDDGNRSDIEIAAPSLVKRGMTGTFNVLAGRLDQTGSLSSGDVRALAAQGMTVGSHGMHHVSWRSLAPAAARDELVTARRILEEVVGMPVDTVALPLGRYDRVVLRHLRSKGYTQVSTSDRRIASDHAWLQHRFSLRADDTPRSVLASVEAAGTWHRRAGLAAVGVVKRWR